MEELWEFIMIDKYYCWYIYMRSFERSPNINLYGLGSKRIISYQCGDWGPVGATNVIRAMIPDETTSRSSHVKWRKIIERQDLCGLGGVDLDKNMLFVVSLGETTRSLRVGGLTLDRTGRLRGNSMVFVWVKDCWGLNQNPTSN